MTRAVDDPLALPTAQSLVLLLFAEHFGIEKGCETRQLLAATDAFARIPYENLTKIIKESLAGSPERARRLPLEVIEDHKALGAGGTCFSLTAALLHIVRALGWRAEPILADRHYGADTHCALLVWLDGRAHLLDPGYLITTPIAIEGAGSVAATGSVRRPTAFHEVELVQSAPGRVDLFTRTGRSRTLRLTYKSAPADPSAFLRAWDTSFSWDMMRYPLLTRVRGGEQIYLQENRLQVRGRDAVSRREVDPEKLAPAIAQEFGIAPSMAERALEILRGKGELRGRAPTP